MRRRDVALEEIFGIKKRGRWTVIRHADERFYLVHWQTHFDKIVPAYVMVAPYRQYLFHGCHAEAGNAEQKMFVRHVQIDRKEGAVAQRPCEFRVFVQFQHVVAGARDDIIEREFVKTVKPVGLI